MPPPAGSNLNAGEVIVRSESAARLKPFALDAEEPDATLLAQDDPSAFFVPPAAAAAAAGGGSAAAAGSSGSSSEVESALRLWGQASAFEDYGNFTTALKAAGKPIGFRVSRGKTGSTLNPNTYGWGDS